MAESSGYQNMNRRQAPRFVCAGAVEISQRGNRWGWGRVNDISHVGCYVEMVHLLSVGTEAQLRLTIADTSLDIAAKVASNDQGIGMGLEFAAVSQEQERKLAQIVRSIAPADLRDQQPDERSRPGVNSLQISREAGPIILAKIIKQINEKGILTRQDLFDIVKSNK